MKVILELIEGNQSICHLDSLNSVLGARHSLVPSVLYDIVIKADGKTEDEIVDIIMMYLK